MRERTYSSLVIARALGVNERTVRNAIRAIAVREKLQSGQQAYACSLGSLPREWIARLDEEANRLNYRNAEHLLSSAVRWVPESNGRPLSLGDIDPAQVQQAQSRRGLLSVELSRSPEGRSDRDIARDVITVCNGKIAICEKTARRWISLVRRRDNGRGEFSRIELYLPERIITRKELLPRRRGRCQCRRIAESLQEIADWSAASFPQKLRIFDAIGKELSSRIALGESEHRARRVVCRFLTDKGVTISKSKEGLRKRVQRICALGVASGWNPVAMREALPESLRAPRGTPGGNPNRKNCGRRPLAILGREEQSIVQGLTVATDPNTGQRISTSMALRLFAQSDRCPDDVAEAILKPRSSKHTITPTLKRQARVTAETKMLHRGEHTFALDSYSQPRGLFYTDARGAVRPIAAGDIFERDDMTLNQPWYVEWQDDGTDPCAAAFGVKLLRGQLLVQIDVGSQRALSFELLARPKDSYRADDIWAWIGRGYRDIGLPRIGERMERGIWEANAIHGIPIAAGAWDQQIRLGGLRELGVTHIPSFAPRTKSIESFFNILQKVLGCTGVQVGRKRGEFEKANKDWLLCRAGKKHPAECGFLHGDELVKRIASAMQFLNGEPREGEVYKGVPDEIWQRDLKATALREIDPSRAWIFYPVKRPATLRDGMVRCRFADHDCSYWFTNPEVFAELGKGHKVIVCFDPAIPEQGAVVFNAEIGSRSKGYGSAQQICVAQLVDRVPQVLCPGPLR